VTEVVVAIIGMVSTLAAVALPLMWRAHGRRLDAITHQVQNDHPTNLREDIDFIRDVVLDVRADIAWLRRDHHDLTARVNRIEGASW